MKLLLAGLLALGAPVSPAAEGTIVPGVNAIPDSYVVVLKEGASMAKVSAKHGGQIGRVFTKALNGYEVTLSARAARKLAADPAVDYVQQNGQITIETAVPESIGALGTQPSPPSWGLDRIDQRNRPLDASYTYPNTGAGVRAYIMTTGIRTTHTDFGGRAIHGWDTVDNDGNATDCNGHGTAVAGITGGTAHGVAKGVTLVAVRLVNCQGTGTYAQLIAGVDWVTTHAIKPAVAVLPAGGTLHTSFNAAVRNSILSGITYSVIGGSQNSNACNYSPGSVAEAITVAATDINDNRHGASNYGSCLDIFAPGIGITTTWHLSDTAVITISGTSFAAAHGGGAAALIAAVNPTWTAQQVRDKLVADATPNVVINPGAGSPNLLVYVANPPACLGSNGINVSIPDSPAAAVNSPVSLSTCTGNAPATATVEVHIIHPYRGDLQLDLIAHDGTTYRLKSLDADSGDDIHTTYGVNLSSEPRNGNWMLRMRDLRAGNVGYLDTWTLRL
jgi:hypothetical protein